MWVADAIQMSDMKQERNCGYRRHLRERSIAHAFHIYWNIWGDCDDVFKWRGWQGYEPIIIEDQQARWEIENQHRADVLNRASKNADHMRMCSCFMCSGYKKYEKSPKQLREIYRDADAAEELFENNLGFNSGLTQ